MLTVNELYAMSTHKGEGGIEGYDFEKKYFDPIKEVQQRELLKVKKGQKDRKHITKRGNYLDDEANLHKIVPGPGKYPLEMEWPEKSKLKINYPDKKTYVDEIVQSEKKEKKPAPGEYNVTKTLEDTEAEKKRLASKKLHYQDRTTYLDGIQYESNQRPGIGNYNPRVLRPSPRTASRPSTPRSSPSPKSGARSTSWSPRRSRRSRPTPPPTTPLPPPSRCSKP
jgi:hypothetical protein